MITPFKHINLFFLLAFFLNINTFAQKEANIWYFGSNAGLDFNNEPPTVLTNGALASFEGCASIATDNGELLFYTDGNIVYNNEHNIMPNGTGLLGDGSSTNSAIIIPSPANNGIYYIFTTDDIGGPNGLNYTEIDMALDGGLGDVVPSKKNIRLDPLNTVTEKLSAIKNLNTNEIWVVSTRSKLSANKEFIAFKVDADSVHTTPVESIVGAPFTTTENNQGAIKISPDGTKIAIANYGNFGGDHNAELFDFDINTGLVSNPILFIGFAKRTYGVEFSNSSKVLYVSELGGGVYQFDLTAGDIEGSKTLINTSSSTSLLQLATNGKIYVAQVDQDTIDVINNPNNIDTGLGEAGYSAESVGLSGRFSRFGLPAFIQTYFLPPNDIQLIKTVNDTIPFEGDTITFTISVTNQGIALSRNINVLDSLPDGLTLLSATPSSGTWTDPNWFVGNLDASEQDSIIITAIVNEGTAGDTITNTAFNTQDRDDENLTADSPSATIIVQIIEEEDEPITELVFPEIVTPNNDGLNDVFEIIDIEKQFPNFSIEIFNRWGNSLYFYQHNGNANENPIWWNNSSSGSSDIVPAGTYHYIIDFNSNDRQPMAGWFYINK